MKVDKGELTKDILVSYHTQFAENQRIKEQYFFRIAGYLGVIIFGYAYVYHNFGTQTLELSFVLIASQILLTLGSSVIVVLSYTWRRDQTVNSKIRDYCNLFGYNKIFPSNYNTRESLQNRCFLNWMPDLFIVFYLSFPIFQILVLVTYLFRVQSRIFSKWSSIDWCITSTIGISITLIILTALIPVFYHYKINRFIFPNKCIKQTANSPQ